MQSDVQLIRTGDKVGASEATLLNMLNISPFSYGLIIQQVYDNGSVYSPEVLDITEEALHKRFLEVSLFKTNTFGRFDCCQIFFICVTCASIRLNDLLASGFEWKTFRCISSNSKLSEEFVRGQKVCERYSVCLILFSF